MVTPYPMKGPITFRFLRTLAIEQVSVKRINIKAEVEACRRTRLQHEPAGGMCKSTAYLATQ